MTVLAPLFVVGNSAQVIDHAAMLLLLSRVIRNPMWLLRPMLVQCHIYAYSFRAQIG